jgi:hypothetical protein
MHRPSFRRLAAAGVGTALGCAVVLGAFAVRPVWADDQAPPKLLIRGPLPEGRHQLPPSSGTSRPMGHSSRSASGWWIGTAGIALALATFGAISLASRRMPTGRGSGPFEVMARASLSPKHTVYLMRAGDQMLILGTGPQGPPALLGEWTGPLELRRPAERRQARSASASPAIDEPIGAEQ